MPHLVDAENHRPAVSMTTWLPSPTRSSLDATTAADDQNRLYGHVVQIGSDESRQMVLLRCPRCGALYRTRHAVTIRLDG